MKLLVVVLLFVAVQAYALEGSEASDSDSSSSVLCFAYEIKKYQDGKYEDDNQSSFIRHNELPVKKSSVFQTLKDILTPETVKKGMEAFISLSENQTVADSDFFNAMQSAADEDNRDTGGVSDFVKKYLHSWCQNGKPSVSGPGVIANRINSTHVLVSQVEIIKSHQNSTGLKWYIPVRILTGEGTTLWTWLEDDGKPKVVPYPESSSWFLVDSKLVPALHRPSLQEKLEDQLHQNHSGFSEVQRVNLIWGASTFNYGQKNIGIHPFLNVTRYITLERSRRVWKEYLENLPFFSYMAHPEFPILEKYIHNQLDSTLAALTKQIEKTQDDNRLEDFLLNEAFQRSSPVAVEMGKNDFKTWKAEGKEEVKDKDLRLMLIAAGEEDFKYFYNETKNYTRGEKEQKLFDLVIYVNDPKLYRRILEEALKDPPVYPLRVISFRADKERVLYSFLEEHISQIPTKEIMISLRLFPVTSKEQLDKKLEFVNKHSATFSDEEKQLLDKVIEKNKMNVVVFGNRMDDIVNWISLQKL